MTEHELREKVLARAEMALYELDALTKSDNLSAPECAKVLQWMVELGVGKARIMEAAAPGGVEGQRFGVVILPAVEGEGADE